jgi:hypothetical protein
MIKPDIEVHPDYVLIERQTIDRPTYYSISQWMEFWEKVQRLHTLKDPERARLYL